MILKSRSQRIWFSPKGKMIHISKDHKRVRKGANKNKLLFAMQGQINSFIISLRASATAWPPPEINTRLGPKRLWRVAITLRSKSVRKATTARAGIITIRREINVFIGEIFAWSLLIETRKSFYDWRVDEVLFTPFWFDSRIVYSCFLSVKGKSERSSCWITYSFGRYDSLWFW